MTILYLIVHFFLYVFLVLSPYLFPSDNLDYCIQVLDNSNSSCKPKSIVFHTDIMLLKYAYDPKELYGIFNSSTSNMEVTPNNLDAVIMTGDCINHFGTSIYNYIKNKI